MLTLRAEQLIPRTSPGRTRVAARFSGFRQVGAIFTAIAAIAWCATPLRAQAPIDYYPTDQWRTSSPDEQALDRKRLKKLVKRIRRNDISGIDSLLIVRNGYLVVESYFNGWGPDADVYAAAGAQGQWIFILPKYDMVVVSTGSTPYFDKAVAFLYSDILRAVN